jgi:hypothetical protein
MRLARTEAGDFSGWFRPDSYTGAHIRSQPLRGAS